MRIDRVSKGGSRRNAVRDVWSMCRMCAELLSIASSGAIFPDRFEVVEAEACE